MYNLELAFLLHDKESKIFRMTGELKKKIGMPHTRIALCVGKKN